MLAFGRYLAFGLVALPLAWLDWRALARLTRTDWLTALRLATVGNIVYYLLLASAIQRAGTALPTVIIGALPVVIALATNWRARRRGAAAALPWRRLLPPLAVIGAGIALVNHAELAQLRAGSELARYALGGLLALGAMVCWTWYPIRNTEWLHANPQHAPRAWATAQGLATLPLAALGWAAMSAVFVASDAPWALPFGPRPEAFIALMLAIGLVSSWAGTLAWNAASQRLPAALSGPLLVFEPLSALAYHFGARGQWPSTATWVGVALLVAGVVWALQVRPTLAAEGTAH